jgi:hypothetical protein
MSIIHKFADQWVEVALAVMPEIAKDVVSLLSFLLPGFLAAWVFYSLTSRPMPAQQEGVFQALIFTLFVKAIVIFERIVLELVGTWKTIRLPRSLVLEN